MKKDGKNSLIVLGMHRSGTSAVTGTLKNLGLQLGRRTYGGHKGINDKGYFENSDIADLNDEVLLAIGSCWDDILPLRNDALISPNFDIYSVKLTTAIQKNFGKAGLWAIKDPRVCKLLPLWIKILKNQGIDGRFLIVLRHPMEVALSLRKRNNFSFEKSIILWLDYNLQAELKTRGRKRTALLYSDLMSSPIDEMERIKGELEIKYPISIDEASGSICEFLAGGLRHYDKVAFHEESNLEKIAEEVYQCLCKLSRGGFTGKDIEKLDDLRDVFESIRDSWPSYIIEHLRGVSIDRSAYRLLWIKVDRSWSWSLGKPIRYMERILGRDI